MRELEKIQREKAQINEEFNISKNTQNNFNIFKANFELILTSIGKNKK